MSSKPSNDGTPNSVKSQPVCPYGANLIFKSTKYVSPSTFVTLYSFTQHFQSIGDRRQALRDRAFQKVRDKTRNEAEFETLVEAAAAEAKAEAEAAAEDEDDEDYEKAAKKSRRKKGSGKKGKTKLKGKGKGKRKKNTPLKGQ